jgi:alanyl-tRNA synthetase
MLLRPSATRALTAVRPAAAPPPLKNRPLLLRLPLVVPPRMSTGPGFDVANWPATRVRKTFVEFFAESCKHTHYRSSPVVPHDDPTLLFANAGMNQFKPIFLGQADPTGPLAPLKRAANSQKCIRAGGKHNDLDDVGKDTYHHTFFEMLGNWSFGDYFKEEAITWAWKLLTEVYGLPKVSAQRGKEGARGPELPYLGGRREGAPGNASGRRARVTVRALKRGARTWREQKTRRPPPHHRILPPPFPPLQDRLYASYFAGGEGLPADTEALEIWKRFLPAERILPFDRKANFWEMGDTGPCGPCSEIHFDRIGGRDAGALVNGDDPTVIEIWNIVFMQFNREPSGQLRELPAKHIDTGMGFERLTSILQGRMSNYDTDIFQPLFDAISRITGSEPYTGRLAGDDVDGKDMAYRVIADHARTLTFAVTDGAVPSNEGRGYVLRRILRRAVRYGQQFLKAKTGFFCQLVPVVVATFKDAFPELEGKEAFVIDVLRDEEESFGRTLSKGIKTFNKSADAIKAAGGKVIPGSDAFFLYDSMGFPLDLTQIMAGEAGLTVDADGFYKCMAEQKARSQAAQKFARNAGVNLVLEAEQTAWLAKSGVPTTDDAAKYTWHARPYATVRAIFTPTGFLAADQAATPDLEAVGIVLDTTPFYGESGGQVSDTGFLAVLPSSPAGADAAADAAAVDGPAPEGSVVFDVEDVQVFGAYILHRGVVRRPEGGAAPAALRVGDRVLCAVDFERRGHVAPNHTMTHVLNFALREVLGDGVEQRGSLVQVDKFRFDFSYGKSVTPDQLERVEKIVGEVIDKALPVYTRVVPLATAKAMHGLRAVFGEVYPDPVRVVTVGADVEAILREPESPSWRGYSLELCGGTHIANTSRAASFAIVEEGSIAKGIRRIIGVTREQATAASDLAAELTGEIAIGRALSGAALDAKIKDLTQRVNDAVISAHVKARFRDDLQDLSKKFLAESRAEAAKLADAGKAVALAALEKAKAEGRKSASCEVPINADGKVAQAVSKAVSDAFPDAAFAGVSTDGKDKVLVFTVAGKAAIAAGVNAKDFVSAALAPADGKGGGRDDAAQGTAKDVGKVAAILEAAGAYLAAKSYA